MTLCPQEVSMFRKLIIAAILMFPVFVEAACPRSIAGRYVLYGGKVGPNLSSARAGMITASPLSGSIGTITVGRFVYNEVGSTGAALIGELSPGGDIIRYTYDGNCFGYVWYQDENDSSKVEVEFLFVSDSGAQMVLIEGPIGQKDSAGNPGLPLPTRWEQPEQGSGVVVFRKQ